MKRFISIFPEGQNIHLIKDVGLISYVLQKHFGYHSTFASYQNGDYPYMDNQVKGLNQVFIKKIFSNQFLDVAIFLILNFRKYDIINIFQLRNRSGFWAVLFKLLTLNRGKVYLKLDSDEKIYDYKPQGIKKTISNFIFSLIDLVSVENKVYAEYLNKKDIFNKKVIHIPNGYYDFSNNETTAFYHKENLIITVGRIGTIQKATEVLCKAFALFAEDHSNWKLEIIGPIDEGFKMFIHQYFLNYPHLRGNASFTGEITDRDVLRQRYKKAKIFALTSRWEGFPNVFVEAIREGCCIVSTDLPAARDITDEGKYGELFPIDDHHALALKFKALADNPIKLQSNCLSVREFAKENYNWITICDRLTKFLG
jgi:glycosyltransferase involved in cell wall biosynthesis